MAIPGDGDITEDEVNEDVYFVGSCNDWMPTKMKSKRRLALEKIPMGENAPASILNIDNITIMYANMVAPGHHYFYFVQGSERVFLSPSYQIVRFKDSNVFVNRITVSHKKHVFDSVFVLKDGAEDEELFLIDHSVFAKYECE